MSTAEGMGAVMVVVEVVDADGQVSIALGRRLSSFANGYYGLPGGKVDEGELPRTAAARELLEETGVRLDEDRLRHIGTIVELQHSNTGDRLIAHQGFCYAVDSDQARPALINVEPESCSGWAYVDLEVLDQLPIVPSHRLMLDIHRGFADRYQEFESSWIPPLVQIA